MRDNSSQIITSLRRCELQYDEAPQFLCADDIVNPQNLTAIEAANGTKRLTAKYRALLINGPTAANETLHLRKSTLDIDEVGWRDDFLP